MGASCDDGCDDDSLAENYEWVMHDADEHEAEHCSPFCGCSCCQILSIEAPSLNALVINEFQNLDDDLSVRLPDNLGHGIWQPPRL